jgi:hypothetical protein
MRRVKIVDGPAETISDEMTRLHYYDSLRVPLMQEARSVSQQAFQGAADAHAAYRERQLQHLEKSLSTDPDDMLSAAAIDSFHSSIDDAVDKRFLTPDEALAEKKAAALRIAEAHYNKLATEDPARAIDELTAEESPHPLVKHFASDTRDALLTLARDNLTAREVDVERNSALATKAQEATADQAERTYIDEAIAGTRDLAGRIANDDALTPEGRSRLFLTLRRTAQPDPPAEVSRATAVTLVDRIRRDDGDAEKITGRTPILEAYNDGKLSTDDYRFLIKQLDDAAHHGAALAAQKRATFGALSPATDRNDRDATAAAPAHNGDQAPEQSVDYVPAHQGTSNGLHPSSLHHADDEAGGVPTAIPVSDNVRRFPIFTPLLPPESIPGSPAFTENTIRSIRKLLDTLDTYFAKQHRPGTKRRRPSSSTRTSDYDQDFCYRRWEEERQECYDDDWIHAHPDYLPGCLKRADERRDSCIRNGGQPHPREPLKWDPDDDEESWINHDR